MINWLKKLFETKKEELDLPEVGDIYWFSDARHWQVIVTKVEDRKVYWRWLDDGVVNYVISEKECDAGFFLRTTRLKEKAKTTEPIDIELYESGMIYFPPPKPLYRKAKDMCDKPNPIETDEGTYYPELPINCGLAHDLMVYEDRYCICEKILYRYCKTDKCFKHYLRDTDQWFNIYNIDLLSNYDWWSTRFEPKSRKTLEVSDVELGDIYEDISNGDEFIVAEKHYRHANNFKLEVALLPLYPSRIIKIIVSLEELKTEYKKINPSQERKEMEYQHSNFTVGEYYKIGEDSVILSQEYDYDFVVYSVEHCLDRNNPIVTFKMKDGSIKSRSDLDNYIKLLNGKPPRTLKLEDLKTLWLKKSSGKILRINTFDKENVYLTPLFHMGYHESQSLNSFFNDFREATQSDLDNLTKGN